MNIGKYKKNQNKGVTPLENTLYKKRQKSLESSSYIKGSLTGFILIEILIASSILAVGMVILISSLNQSLHTSETIYHESMAILLAQTQLSYLQDKLYPYGTTRGNCSQENKDFCWEVEATPIDDFLDKIKIRIIWNEKNVEKEVALYTYLARREK